MGRKVIEPFTAMQYLTWAIEEIDQFGHPLASHDARRALAELKSTQRDAETRMNFIRENLWPQRNDDDDEPVRIRRVGAQGPLRMARRSGMDTA